MLSPTARYTNHFSECILHLVAYTKNIYIVLLIFGEGINLYPTFPCRTLLGMELESTCLFFQPVETGSRVHQEWSQEQGMVGLLLVNILCLRSAGLGKSHMPHREGG